MKLMLRKLLWNKRRCLKKLKVMLKILLVRCIVLFGKVRRF